MRFFLSIRRGIFYPPPRSLVSNFTVSFTGRMGRWHCTYEQPVTVSPHEEFSFCLISEVPLCCLWVTCVSPCTRLTPGVMQSSMPSHNELCEHNSSPSVLVSGRRSSGVLVPLVSRAPTHPYSGTSHSLSLHGVPSRQNTTHTPPLWKLLLQVLLLFS